MSQKIEEDRVQKAQNLTKNQKFKLQILVRVTNEQLKCQIRVRIVLNSSEENHLN